VHIEQDIKTKNANFNFCFCSKIQNVWLGDIQSLYIENVCLFTVLRPAQEFFTYLETLPLAGKGFKT
jgi:hypothetical protein